MYPDFFRVAALKKIGVIRENLDEHPEKKILVDATLKKYQVAPYKNLGRFHRAPFKSLFRLQIKRVIISRIHNQLCIALLETTPCPISIQ